MLHCWYIRNSRENQCPGIFLMCTLTSPSTGRGTPRRSSETIPGSPFGNPQNELLGEKEGRWRKAKKKKNELVSDCESDMSDEVGNEKKRRIQEKESAIDAGGRGTPRSASREIPGSPFASALVVDGDNTSDDEENFAIENFAIDYNQNNWSKIPPQQNNESSDDMSIVEFETETTKYPRKKPDKSISKMQKMDKAKKPKENSKSNDKDLQMRRKSEQEKIATKLILIEN